MKYIRTGIVVVFSGIRVLATNFAIRFTSGDFSRLLIAELLVAELLVVGLLVVELLVVGLLVAELLIVELFIVELLVVELLVGGLFMVWAPSKSRGTSTPISESMRKYSAWVES